MAVIDRLIKVAGFLILTLFVTDALTLFIVGLATPPFARKWWALFAFTALGLGVLRVFWKRVRIE